MKFRAWDDVNKVMVYGSSGIATLKNTDVGKTWFPTQRFSITDVAGNEVYENDIVELWHKDNPKNKIIAVVEWFESIIPNFIAQTHLESKGKEYLIGGDGSEPWASYLDKKYIRYPIPDHKFKVLGNTYTNSDLVECNK